MMQQARRQLGQRRFGRLPSAASLRPFTKTSAPMQGRKPEDHVTNQDHDLNVHSAASRGGQRDRGTEGQSQATSERDHGSDNAKAEKDHPEAPKPVIGMNDEKGRKGQ
ncbi:MAG: hypothetical protein M1825_002209 [Sarcosagium campestre]|nr:MAG: hypothetical protein M1825_002209 [Sarcosagium campestre]